LIECSVGVMAHNEAKNIGNVLDRLAGQSLERASITEIIVVASGCDDGTEDVVRRKAESDPRVRLVVEPARKGKAEAVNRFLAEATKDVCVVVGADTLPDSRAVEFLCLPLERGEVGMTGARPIPLNSKKTFPGYVVHFLWSMHHDVALKRPKCGEMVAFKKVFDRLPADTVVDEPQIEALVRAAGLQIVYEPRAEVYNLGPDNLREIVMRRRSIVAGYERLSRRTTHRTATQSLRWWLLSRVAVRAARGEEPLLFLAGAVAVELAARVLGYWDAVFSKEPLHIWPPAESTKDPAASLPPRR